MNISTQRTGGTLIISLSGELDHHATRKAIPQISKHIDIELPIELIIDFQNVTFMDSSGIALAIGAYKRAKTIDSDFSIINVPKQAFKVFNAAGIYKIINITEEKQKTTIF